MEKILHFDEIVKSFEWIPGVTPLSSLNAPITVVLVYLIVVYAIFRFKKDQKASDLKNLVLMHNAFLILISAAMFLGTAVGLVEQIQVTITTRVRC